MRYFGYKISMFLKHKGILKVYEIMCFRASPTIALVQLFPERENTILSRGLKRVDPC